MQLSRREVAAALAGAAAASTLEVDAAVVQRHDQAVAGYLERQQTDPASPWCGGLPDAYGLHHAGSAAGLLDAFTAAFVCPQSKFHKDPLVARRFAMAADFLARKQTPDGNFDLLTTNFNSPPDTGFLTLSAAAASHNARHYGAPEFEQQIAPWLQRAGAAMARGGIHTPNHRWVVCDALARLNALYPDPAYVRRIDQWLAEGIDIDADGQFSERSTVVYNGVTTRSLVALAIKLQRWDLLEPVRRNLDAMMYLLHPGGEVVTEISRRQDLNQRGTMAGYWLALRYLSRRDQNGQYAAMERMVAPSASLSQLLEFSELRAPGPAPAALPENFEKQFPHLRVARIRRGWTSATILDGRSRFFLLRRGDAVISARFASAFFGKGQFISQRWEKRGSVYWLEQRLEGPYYQPLDPPERVGAEDWERLLRSRKRTEVCRLTQSAEIAEQPHGFAVRIRVDGTRDVPVAIEINLAEGAELEGCRPLGPRDAWLLADGYATYRAGAHTVRFGPGQADHRYVEVRGAEPKLPGPSVYITGFAPWDKIVHFLWPY